MIFTSLLLACVRSENKKLNQFPEKSIIHGLASPIQLNHDSTMVYLEDYFVDAQLIDSVNCNLQSQLSVDKKLLTLIANQSSNIPNVIDVWSQGHCYSILVRPSKKKKVVLKLEDSSKIYQKVQLASEINDWNPDNTNFTFNNGVWKSEMWLNPGSYQYQYVIDGKWKMDSSNPDSASNGIGGWNSLLHVGEIDEIAPVTKLKTSMDSLIITFDNSKGYFVFWDNFLIHNGEDENGSLAIKVPEEAGKKLRSHIRIFAFNDGEIVDMLVPLENGKVITNTAMLSNDDKHTAVLYFMLVDRFNNGNQENDDPLIDSEIHDKANYYGGDIAGIIQKLNEGYFDEIGINTIWLSPVTQNPLHGEIEYPAPQRKYSGYHGYWPISCTQIDHRLGTDKELIDLVDLAHSKGMKVVLDYVSNHVHQENPVIQQHPDWATELELADGRKNIRIWDEQRLTTWFDTFLPTLNYDKPEVVDLMTDSAFYMLKKYELDGFRHDATKHIPEVFWRTLTKKIKQQIPNKSIYQIGETFGSRELIGNYVGSGQMDGQFDFNLYFDMRMVFAKDEVSFQKLHQSLLSSLSYYGCHSLMGNITGNHDIPRFISYAGEGLAFDEDEKEAGWEREVRIENPVGYKKLSMLSAFIMTIPGIPVIYYGDEIGMVGAGDPDNRRPMRFSDLSEEELKVKNNLKSLVKMRNQSMALLYGDYQLVHVSDKLYAFTRSYFEENILVIFNKSNNIEILNNQGVEYKLEPYSYKIIKQ